MRDTPKGRRMIWADVSGFARLLGQKEKDIIYFNGYRLLFVRESNIIKGSRKKSGTPITVLEEIEKVVFKKNHLLKDIVFK